MGAYEHVAKKTLAANVAFRTELRQLCRRDAGLRKAMIDRCREDILFFFSAFCWLHEPRVIRVGDGGLQPHVIPFIPWPHQVPVIQTLEEHLGEEEIGVLKSRSEGMSWIAVLKALKDWLFSVPGKDMVTIGIVSRNMEMADTPSDISSLMAKLDWELERLPTWMVGRRGIDYQRNLSKHTLRNRRNDSLITAYAATGEVGSGGRYTYWIVDELSKFRPGEDRDAITSTQATTNSRLIIGTPYGGEGAYYDVMHEPSSMIRLELKWEDNPTRNRGLYRMVRGVPVAVDPATNPLPKNYDPPNLEVRRMFVRLRRKGFALDRGERSPWYDHECDRPEATPSKIAQELGRDFGGSLNRVLTEDFFAATRRTVRPPFTRANVLYDDRLRAAVSESPDGELLLWVNLDHRNRPPAHAYVVSADVATGSGTSYASNSALEILDLVTMEQVGELASNTIAPEDFANLAMAICYWLGDAYLAWERNGPGGAFGARVKEAGYPDVYLRTKLFDKRRRKKTSEPGFWMDRRSKEIVFSEMRRVVTTGEVKLRSSKLVAECQNYVRIGKTIEHVTSARARADDPDAGENHGDRVIAMGVGIQASQDRPVSSAEREAEAIEPGSIEERDREWAMRQQQWSEEWDSRTNWDLMGGSPGFPGVEAE